MAAGSAPAQRTQTSKKLLVANGRSDGVMVIDTENLTATAEIPVGTLP